MRNLTKTSAIIIIAATAGLVSTTAFAQTSNTGGTGGYGGGQGFGGSAGKGGESDNNNMLKAKIIKPGSDKNPNYPRPRRPKTEEAAFKSLSQRDPCLAVHNMITRQNMLVMVPRYNDCIRRHGNNK